MNIQHEQLDPKTFAPFGQVIQKPDREMDASGPGWMWWGENQLMAGGDRPYAIGYLDLQPAAWRFDWAERHMHSDELIVPSRGDCLIYVGPAEHMHDPMHLPELENFRVFLVPQGQGVLLAKGVWHGAPLALDRPANAVVVLQQFSGKEDGYVVRFEDTPVDIVP